MRASPSGTTIESIWPDERGEQNVGACNELGMFTLRAPRPRLCHSAFGLEALQFVAFYRIYRIYPYVQFGCAV